MKHKGGEVYGSIYERRRENGSKSYTAEILKANGLGLIRMI